MPSNESVQRRRTYLSMQGGPRIQMIRTQIRKVESADGTRIDSLLRGLYTVRVCIQNSFCFS